MAGSSTHVCDKEADLLNDTTLLALCTPALITPGKKFGLPPLWATLNAIQKCRMLKIDKDIIYALLVTRNLSSC